ncbi:MAG: hypothetical protein BHW07_01685 [Clostridium sp. CAG_433_25_7]|nr:MAG: hypothetical protein BHW07_01685 [Clostridium sp. CAG_433_25_7]
MANIRIYNVENVTTSHKNVMFNIYQDFFNKSESDYAFESEPVDFYKFFECIESRLLKSIVLLESGQPIAFLIYTMMANYCVEINLIHMFNFDDYENKVELLINKLLKNLKEDRIKKTISYPLIGIQEKYFETLTKLNFESVENSIYVFPFNEENQDKINKASHYEPELNDGFKIEAWNNDYFSQVVKLLNVCFSVEKDALYDSRYKTEAGTRDILNKIIDSEYGIFLPNQCSILLDNEKVIGVCLANLTTFQIANIPQVAVLPQYRGNKYGTMLVKNTLSKIASAHIYRVLNLKELNVTSITNHNCALNMYIENGFEFATTYNQLYYNFNYYK